MAIVSRERLDIKGSTKEEEEVQSAHRAYEHALFQEAMRSLPSSILSPEGKKLLKSDTELKDSYLADLLDDEKQEQFSQKLGSDVLRAFNNNRTVNMLRNDAVHGLKKVAVFGPKGAAMGDPLDVTNRKAFTATGQRKDENAVTLGQVRDSENAKVREQVESRRVDPEAFGMRTHSIGDEQSKTLYFAGKEDALSLEASVSFTYDDVEMGSALQGVMYAQAKLFNDPSRALALSAEPMTKDDILKRGMGSTPYSSPDQRETWNVHSEQIMYDVLKAKYATNDKAQEALKQTDGYKLMYASTSSAYGIGRNVSDIMSEQETAVRNNQEFVVDEINPESNNIVGRMTERVRNEMLQVEKEDQQRAVQYGDNPFGDFDAADPSLSGSLDTSSNPFAQGNGSFEDMPRSIHFDNPDEESVGFSSYYETDEPVPVLEEDTLPDFESVTMPDPNERRKPIDVNTNPFETAADTQPSQKDTVPEKSTVEPLEMSIHASENLTPNGVSRASDAVKRFGEEASRQNRPAVVYVPEDAPNTLKKAVYFHKDAVTMAPVDENHVPNRSLIVQNEQSMSRSFMKQVQFATQDSHHRDVRALSVDSAEKDMYALNDYLVNQSGKVKVTFENDGIEKAAPVRTMPEQPAVRQNPFVQPSRENEDAKAALRMNQQHMRSAQETARQKAQQSTTNPAKGVYAENPFA